jgi:flagellar biosynthesis protein FlhF
MRIKKFVADTAKEALLQVRQELGPKAVILKTQREPSKSLFGFLGKGKVEITAALDEGLYVKPQPPATEKKITEAVHALQRYNRNGEKVEAVPGVDPSAPKAAGLTDEKFRLAEIHSDVEEVKSVLRNLAEHLRNQDMPPLPERVADFCFNLVDRELNKELAVKVGLKLQGALNEKELENPKKIRARAAEVLADMVTASGPVALKEKRATRVMLVGPTGAGKTTTLAKLAAQYGILQRKRVRIITADTYRIAAVEQLRTFAEISDIPMEVVFTPEEMHRAVAKMTPSSDLILIDTAGRSQLHAEHMNDLKAMIEAADPDELHLVLSATTKLSDLEEAADQYRLLGVNRYLFTKLDETTRYGTIFNLLFQTKMLFSYVTTGQSVPDDIEEGNAVRMAERLVRDKLCVPG